MKHADKRHGFSIPELLLALVILSMLLAAVAAAVHASLMNQEENADIADATQAGRVVLNRIAGDIRTAAAVDYASGPSTITIVPPENGSGVTEIEYAYDSADRTLLYKVSVGANTTTHTLIGGDGISVKSFSALHEIGEDWQGLSCTRSVTLRMELEIDGKAFNMTASAAPRRNQVY